MLIRSLSVGALEPVFPGPVHRWAGGLQPVTHLCLEEYSLPAHPRLSLSSDCRFPAT